MPGLLAIRTYRREWLLRDVVAGLALAAILAPTGMGYASAAGLPPICGLYATLVPLLVYSTFGPSRILVLGPDSALAGLVAAAVLPLAAGDPDRAVGLAGMLAVLSGVLCLVGGLFRVAFVTELLSKPIRFGYLNGIAVTVLIGQLPKLLGFPVDGESLPQELGGLLRGFAQSRINGTSAAIGASCLGVVFACRRWRPAIPGVLLAIVGATIAVWFFDLQARAGVAAVGPLARGLPAWRWPGVSLSELGVLVPDACAIALVSFGDMSVVSRTFAQLGGYRVDGDQEACALGLANIATGMLQGFPVTSSASRTSVSRAAGAQTQLASVTGAACLALLLFVAPAVLRHVPVAALGAVVISACMALVEVRGVLRLWEQRRSEFAFSVICFLGVALLGVIQGIFIAVGIALLEFVWRAWRPHDAVLGSVEGLRGYHDVARHPDARRIPGLVLFRWDAPLFFANAEIFRDRVRRAVADAPTPTRLVVVAAEPVTDIDVTAADMLEDFGRELRKAGVELGFAELKGPVKDQLKRYGLFARIGGEHFFPTVGSAVECFLGTGGLGRPHGDA
jgi:high affinity sulfate transporter 1